MALSHALIAVGTTATKVSLPEQDSTPGQALIVQNQSTTVVYLGSSEVTTSDYGHALGQDGTLTIITMPGEELYAVASVETTVAVLAVGA